MLTSIYYSEKREKLILVQLGPTAKVMKVIMHKLPFKKQEEIGFLKENLRDTLVEKGYELIGFYNE